MGIDGDHTPMDIFIELYESQSRLIRLNRLICSISSVETVQ